MINFGLLILELGLIYLSRGHLTKQLFRLINSLGGGYRAFTAIWSMIFLPGTIIHEMSHFFAAAFTGTHIGKVEIFPTFNDEKSIHLGSVQTQELGLFRGFIVGSAPFLIGLGLLIWLSSIFDLRFTNSELRITICDLIKLYFFFTISNSLFLSWADFKHALPLIAIAVILGAVFFAIGVQPMISTDPFIFEIISRLQTALAWSVGINVAATGLVWGANKLL